MRAALAQLAPDSKTGRPWNSTPEDSNYDPCADLSAVLVTVQDATNSSPDQALMFHRGTFVGTATPRAYPFTNLIGPASTNDIVVLSYRGRCRPGPQLATESLRQLRPVVWQRPFGW